MRRGDANICGDVGSPMVVRFGEKGLMWVEVEAHGLAGARRARPSRASTPSTGCGRRSTG